MSTMAMEPTLIGLNLGAMVGLQLRDGASWLLIRSCVARAMRRGGRWGEESEHDGHIETIGCDLGDRQSELCILLPSGKVERPKAVRTTRAAMRAFFARPQAHVVIEVGSHSR